MVQMASQKRYEAFHISHHIPFCFKYKDRKHCPIFLINVLGLSVVFSSISFKDKLWFSGDQQQQKSPKIPFTALGAVDINESSAMVIMG